MGYTGIFWDVTLCNSVEAPTFRKNVHSPSAGKASNHQETGLFATCFLQVTYLAYSSTLKIELTHFSETSVNFKGSAWCHIAEEAPDLDDGVVDINILI